MSGSADDKVNDCYEGNDSSDEDMEAADSLVVCLEPSCCSSNRCSWELLRVISFSKIINFSVILIKKYHLKKC